MLSPEELARARREVKSGFVVPDTSRLGAAYGVSKRFHRSMYSGPPEMSEKIGILGMSEALEGRLGPRTRTMVRMEQRASEVTSLQSKYDRKFPPAFVTYEAPRGNGYVANPAVSSRAALLAARRIIPTEPEASPYREADRKDPTLAYDASPKHETKRALVTDRKEREAMSLEGKNLEKLKNGYNSKLVRDEIRTLRNYQRLAAAKSDRVRSDPIEERRRQDVETNNALVAKADERRARERATLLDLDADPDRPYYELLPGRNPDPPTRRPRLHERAEDLAAAEEADGEADGGARRDPGKEHEVSLIFLAAQRLEGKFTAPSSDPRPSTAPARKISSSFTQSLLEDRGMVKTTARAVGAIDIDLKMTGPMYSSFSKDGIYREPSLPAPSPPKPVKIVRARPKTAADDIASPRREIEDRLNASATSAEGLRMSLLLSASSMRSTGASGSGSAIMMNATKEVTYQGMEGNQEEEPEEEEEEEEEEEVDVVVDDGEDDDQVLVARSPQVQPQPPALDLSKLSGISSPRVDRTFRSPSRSLNVSMDGAQQPSPRVALTPRAPSVARTIALSVTPTAQLTRPQTARAQSAEPMTRPETVLSITRPSSAFSLLNMSGGRQSPSIRTGGFQVLKETLRIA